MKTIHYKGKTWYWIKYQYLIDELPIIGIKNREALSRRLKKLVSAGIFEKHIVKSAGTYTYYRLNEIGYIRLLRDPQPLLTSEHPTQKSGVIGTPDSKVDPNDPTQKSGDTRPKSRPKDPNTINPSLSLIVAEAAGNINFNHAFNDFCTGDSEEYRKDRSYWIFRNAIKYSCSLGDVIDALEICCAKEKQGDMAYFTGILRNKAMNRKTGIKPFGKPDNIVLNDYLRSRLSGHMDILSNWEVDHENQTVYYTLKNYDDRDVIQEVFDKVISIDVINHTGIELEFAMR